MGRSSGNWTSRTGNSNRGQQTAARNAIRRLSNLGAATARRVLIDQRFDRGQGGEVVAARSGLTVEMYARRDDHKTDDADLEIIPRRCLPASGDEGRHRRLRDRGHQRATPRLGVGSCRVPTDGFRPRTPLAQPSQSSRTGQHLGPRWVLHCRLGSRIHRPLILSQPVRQRPRPVVEPG